MLWLPQRASPWPPLFTVLFIYKAAEDWPALTKLLFFRLEARSQDAFSRSHRLPYVHLASDVLATVLTKGSPFLSKGTQAGYLPSRFWNTAGSAFPTVLPASRAEANYLTLPVKHVGPEGPVLACTGHRVPNTREILSFLHSPTQQPLITSPVLAAGGTKVSKHS